MGDHPVWRIWSGGWHDGQPPVDWWRGRDGRWYPPGVEPRAGGGTWRGSVAEVRPQSELVTVGGTITGSEAQARLAHPAGRARLASAARPSPDVWSSWTAAPTRVPSRAPSGAYAAAPTTPRTSTAPTAPAAPTASRPGAGPGPIHAGPAARRPRRGTVAAVAAVAALALGVAGWSALRAEPSEPQADAPPATAPCGVDLDGDGDLDTC